MDTIYFSLLYAKIKCKQKLQTLDFNRPTATEVTCLRISNSEEYSISAAAADAKSLQSCPNLCDPSL